MTKIFIFINKKLFIKDKNESLFYNYINKIKIKIFLIKIFFFKFLSKYSYLINF